MTIFRLGVVEDREQEEERDHFQQPYEWRRLDDRRPVTPGFEDGDEPGSDGHGSDQGNSPSALPPDLPQQREDCTPDLKVGPTGVRQLLKVGPTRLRQR